MPIKIPDTLPAFETLVNEGVRVMTETVAIRQDIRPLQIGLLNLMPNKIKTEVQMARLVGASPLQVELSLIRVGGHRAKNTSEDHLLAFYDTWEEVKHRKFDGFIITGAPVEKLDFADVLYWEELTRVMDWADQRVFSTLFICWAAQAGLYYHYGIQKHPLSQKLFGVFDTSITDPYDRLLCGLDDTFTVPMSRHTALDEEALARCAEVTVLATSPETGAALVRSKDGRRVFATGHSEYDRDSLAHEYTRDVAKNLPIDLPRHYYPGDDPAQTPPLRWHAHASVLFSNWLNYFVYQETPFDLRQGFAPLKAHYENSQS